MKKLIAILMVMAIVAGAVFAVTNDKIVLTSDVEQIKPEFKIQETTTDTDGVATEAGVEVETAKDISVEGITWPFEIRQEGEKKAGGDGADYSKYNKPVEVTVTLYPFKATIGGVLYTEAGDITITDEDAADIATANANCFTIGTPVVTDNVIKYTITYTGKKVVDQVIGTFTGNWPADSTLPIATGETKTTYKADIKLTYTVE